MSTLKINGLELELLAAKAGRLLPRRRKREDVLERELEARQAEERKGILERARRKTED